MLFTDAHHYAYSTVIWAVESPEDLRPVTFTLGSSSDMQQRWYATKKEVYAIYQSVLQYDLYFRGAKCVLHCDYKLLEPFLSQGIKIPKLNRWCMELSDYNIMFVNIKGKHNTHADAISRLKK